ncbi:MAG TPA: hypothetical protein VIF62_07060 [Labilithrix sp.]|jgi:hypothetical protein
MKLRVPIVLALSLVARSAYAEDAPEPKPEPRVWYGWETATVDAVGLGLSLVSRAAMPYCLATLAGAPAVHIANDHPVRALVDFGLRVVLPTSTGLIASGPYDPAPIDSDAKLHRFATGAIIAAAAVALFDAAFLADGIGRF